MYITIIGYVDGHVAFFGPFESEEAGKQYAVRLCEFYTSIYRWHVVPIIHPLKAGERS